MKNDFVKMCKSISQIFIGHVRSIIPSGLIPVDYVLLMIIDLTQISDQSRRN